MRSGQNRPASTAGNTALCSGQAEADQCQRQAEAMFVMAMGAMLRDERLEYMARAEHWLGRADDALREGYAGQVDPTITASEDA